MNDFANGVKEKNATVLDEHGDGEIGIEDIIIKELKTSGIRIDLKQGNGPDLQKIIRRQSVFIV